MPEYLALTHYRNATSDEGEPLEPPSVDEVNDMFARMESAGIGKAVH